MKNKVYNKNILRMDNPLSRYDPDQPTEIPKEYNTTYKRSVYFPRRKATLLYQINQMIKESVKAGRKLNFNDIAIEALECWYKQNRRKHFAWLLYRLTNEKDTLAYQLKNLRGVSKNTSQARELSNRHDKVMEAIFQIEKFLYREQRIIPTGDFEMLIAEIIQSLKKHSSTEMVKALSKVLSRLDIHEIAAQVRHKPKIERKKSIFGRNKSEEPEWYD